MKEGLALILGLGLIYSPSLSGDSATYFYSIVQIKKLELTPHARALDFLRSRNVWQAEDNPLTFWHGSQNHFTTDSGASEQEDTERNRIRIHRLISGLGLVASYATTVIVDLQVYDPYQKYTLIPVIGPFIALGEGARHHAIYFNGGKELLILSGVAQCAFATYFVISLAKHPKSSETKNLTVWSSLNSINLSIQF